MEQQTMEPAASEQPVQGGVVCPVCPEHEPFADEEGLRMHGVRSATHKSRLAGIPDESDHTAPPPLPSGVIAGPDGKASPESIAAALARIDIAHLGSEGRIDDSFDAILARQRAHSLFDPVTLKRVVVYNGKVHVRQTVGTDAVRGQENRVDYYDPAFGWIRDGYINERGRVYVTPDGPLVL